MILIVQNASAQQFEVLEKSELVLNPQSEKFIFISEKTPLSQNTFVATFKVTGIFKHMLPLYYQIKNKAQHLGANSFRFRSLRKLEKEKLELIVETYFNRDEFFEENTSNIPKNKVFIFGKPSFPDNKTLSLKINDEIREISSGKYLELTLSEKMKISKGGFMGTHLSLSPNSTESSFFLILSGGGIAGATSSPSGAGLNFNTGAIDRLDDELGLLLLKIYEENQKNFP